MFHSTRLKLTAWYLLIIGLISAFFSLAMYRVLTSELDRVERMQRLRTERVLPRPPYLDHELIVETKNRIKMTLILIDMGIISISAAAAYFLAGRTLRPIRLMVEEQHRFITDASHELRTPLTSLKSEIEVGLRDQNLTVPEARKLLRSNLEEVDSLQTLSDGLIKLSRYSKGRNNFRPVPVFLPEIVSQAVKKISGPAKVKDISIRREVADVNFAAEPQSLVELLIILLDNAVKYSPVGSQIVLWAGSEGKNVLITVSDQGIGIGSEDLPRIFDRFYRADVSRTKSAAAGYGLGLSIAKQIVDRHHGSIKVKSVLRHGTVFTVSLPQI